MPQGKPIAARVSFPDGVPPKWFVTIEQTIVDPFTNAEITVQREFTLADAEQLGIDLTVIETAINSAAAADNATMKARMAEILQLHENDLVVRKQTMDQMTAVMADV
jgi:hypothetical protein